MKITSTAVFNKHNNLKLNYLITAPSGFDISAKAEKLPLIVFLHGMGERGDNIELIKLHGVPKLFDRNQDYKGLRVITLSPQCPDGSAWINITTPVKELIDIAASEYNVDIKKISITGISMGGFGTWEMAMRFPHAFSACAPICGGGQSFMASALRDMPIRAFHGEADTVVSVEYTRDMIKAIKNAGGDPDVTYYPGIDHNCWDLAYEQTNLIPWLAGR